MNTTTLKQNKLRNAFVEPEAQTTPNSKKTAKKAKKSPITTDSNQEILLKLRKLTGFLLIAIGLFSVVACISHFFSGAADQSLVQNVRISVNVLKTSQNIAGAAGAYFANLLITNGFGVVGILLPIYVALFGYATLENKLWNTLYKLFLYLNLVLYWTSATLALVSIAFALPNSDLGGALGRSIVEWLAHYVGLIGVGILLIFTTITFAILKFNTQLNFLKTITNFIDTPTPAETTPDPENKDNKDQKEEPEEPIKNNTNQTDNQDDEPTVIATETKQSNPQPEPSQNPLKNPFKTSLPEPKIIDIEADIEPTVIPANAGISNKHPDDIPFEITLPNTDNQNPAFFELDFAVPQTHHNQEVILDNIVSIGNEKYQKDIPDSDLETLPDDEILGDWEPYDPKKDLSNYQYPPIELLTLRESPNGIEVNRTELEANKNMIVQTLRDFKIEITQIKATIGPTITLYEVVPAPGVKISKIKGLEDDIALSLKALGIRIIAPMPGKGTIGIEIPNSKPEIVSIRSLIATEKFRDTDAKLPLVLGKTISNEVYIADLAKMPHLLVAGATGMGKSVGLNGIIASLIYKLHPAQIKFVLIDPKKVEMALYQALEKHFLAKLPGTEEAIITDNHQVVNVLNSLCLEMEERYTLLKEAGVRQLFEYNDKFTARRLNPKKGHRFLPYIVLIIDELADLMMTAGKEIETPICRLAQLARAVGIHLVVATQRPSVNVITGIIKANFPARLSFRVTQKTDSRTILDSNGAEQLVGRGDMLFSNGSDLIRLQNAFIDTPEVEDIVNFITKQKGYPQPYYLPEPPVNEKDKSEDEDGALFEGERDPMFNEAARLIIKHQQGSTSLIQRRLKLGYNRAGRIMEQLEQAGIVGGSNGSKPREVLFSDEISLEKYLSNLG